MSRAAITLALSVAIAQARVEDIAQQLLSMYQAFPSHAASSCGKLHIGQCLRGMIQAARLVFGDSWSQTVAIWPGATVSWLCMVKTCCVMLYDVACLRQALFLAWLLESTKVQRHHWHSLYSKPTLHAILVETGQHWALAVLLTRTGHMHVYDGLRDPQVLAECRALAAYLREHAQMQIEEPRFAPVAQQRDTHSCGSRVVRYLQVLSLGSVAGEIWQGLHRCN